MCTLTGICPPQINGKCGVGEMNSKSKYPFLRHIDFLAADLAALLASFTLAFFIKFEGLWLVDGNGWSSAVWARLLLLFTIADVLLTFILNPYSGIFKRKYYMEIVQALRLTLFNAISVSIVLYVFKIGEDYSRTVYILTYVFYFVLSLTLKYIWKKLITSGIIKAGYSKNISLFIAASEDTADSVLASVSAGDYDPYDIKGMYLAGSTREEYNGIKLFGPGFADYVVENNISDVFISLPPQMIEGECYKKLIDNGINVHIWIEPVIGMQTEHQFVSELGISKALSITAFSFRPGQILYLGVKRVLDLIFGLLGLVFMIPITLFIKLAYLISGDRAKIFYTQKRVGKNGKTIRILKYRTMVADADAQLEKLLEDEDLRREWEANQKLRNDPRITKVGRILRKTSLDELPQVVNLIKGDMSLVGPRPLIEGELEDHEGLKLYQRIKPGITGWWACNGRSNIEYRERLELEYYYIKNFSMYLDVLCIFRTVLAVLKKDGAE